MMIINMIYIIGAVCVSQKWLFSFSRDFVVSPVSGHFHVFRGFICSIQWPLCRTSPGPAWARWIKTTETKQIHNDRQTSQASLAWMYCIVPTPFSAECLLRLKNPEFPSLQDIFTDTPCKVNFASWQPQPFRISGWPKLWASCYKLSVNKRSRVSHTGRLLVGRSILPLPPFPCLSFAWQPRAYLALLHFITFPNQSLWFVNFIFTWSQSMRWNTRHQVCPCV